MWLNISTGNQVPESEVHEQAPGLFVQRVPVKIAKSVRGRFEVLEAGEDREPVFATVAGHRVLGHVIKVPDGTTFDPARHTLHAIFAKAVRTQNVELALIGGAK